MFSKWSFFSFSISIYELRQPYVLVHSFSLFLQAVGECTTCASQSSMNTSESQSCMNTFVCQSSMDTCISQSSMYTSSNTCFKHRQHEGRQLCRNVLNTVLTQSFTSVRGIWYERYVTDRHWYINVFNWKIKNFLI